VVDAVDTNPAGGIAHADAADGGRKRAKRSEGFAAASGQGSSSFLLTIALCFGAVLLDGLDTSSIGVAGPAIAAHFQVAAASLTAPFVMTSVGAVIGYLLSGSVVRRWNARRVLLTSVVAFGALSLATPYAGSIAQLAIVRLMTAIGFGLALPSAIAIAVEQSPMRLREAVTAVVGTGLAAGGVLGGLLGGMITKRYGWECLFYIGGALPLLLSVCLWRWLPGDSADTSSASAGGATSFSLIKSLLANALGFQTVALWTFSFLIFSNAYALLFWLPPLLIGFGYSPENAQFGVGVFSAGGLFANIGLVLLLSRFSVATVMLIAASVAALSVLGIAFQAIIPLSIWALVAAAGAGLIASSVGQSALAVSIYPPALRTNGVGFSAAAGRVGSVVGPAVAGLLFALGWSPKWVLLAACGPILIAALVLAPLAWRARQDVAGDVR
jgi:AAHS family 4-hydroxybenzoate transporter-like MFS transporter